MIKVAFSLKVDLWPSDFAIKANLKTYRLALVDDDGTNSALVVAIPTRVVPQTSTAFVAAISGPVELSIPAAPTKVALAP